MKLRMALDAKMQDVRLRDRLLSDGKITKAEIQTYLDNLADDEGSYVRIGEETPETTETITE